MKFTTSVILVICVLFLRISHAQHAGCKLYTVADGLVQSEVTCLHQDTKGFLWIGTKNGISLFDGQSFHTIHDSAGVSEAWVKYIADLNDSTVWLFTTRGCVLYTYGSQKISIRSYPVDFGSAGYWTKNGTGYFVTAALELYQVDSRGMKHVNTNIFDGIKKVVPDGGWVDLTYSKLDGNFYFRTKPGFLGCLRNDKIVYLPASSFGHLWTGMDDRIYFLTPQMEMQNLRTGNHARQAEEIRNKAGETTKLFCIADTLLTLVADFGRDKEMLENSMLILNKDTIYATSAGKSLIRTFIHGKVTEYKYPFAYVNSMIQDQEHNLWLGSAAGLARMQPFSFSHFSEADGIYSNIQCVGEDKDQNLIVGGYEKGIQKIENGRVTNIPGPLMPNTSVTWQVYPACMKDKEGNLQISVTPFCWITWDGKKLSHDPALPIMASLSFCQDTISKILYSGTDQGLLVHKESSGGYKLLKKFPGNCENKAVSLAMDNSGTLWMGGFKGLSFMEGEKITDLPNSEFPYNQGANAMAKDHRGNIWIGNSQGLWLFDMKRFRKIQNPWFNDIVVSLCFIDSAKLFIGGLHGAGFLDVDAFYKKDTAIIRYFNNDNGFTGNECQQNGVYLDSRGILWVATTSNLQRIDPRNLPPATAGPRVYFEKISLLDETMKLVPFIQSYVSKGCLELKHDMHNIRFDFTAPVFRGNSFVRFRYCLEGQDKEWSQPTSERYCVYTNLAPGSYTFKVIACNDAGVWSESPARFDIQIDHAFWQTWWSWVVIVILPAGFFFWLGYLFMSRRKKTMQEKLESEKKIAELQLIAIRNQIDPHFTVNAMNSIAAVIMQEDKEKAYSFFVKLSGMIRQVLTSGDKITRTLADELVFVQNYLEIEKLRFDDALNYRIDLIQPVNLNQEVPKMVIQTYAENALKHGLLNKKDGNGELIITIGERDNKLYIEIADNGVGRDEAKHNGEKSTGKGMMIMNFYYDFFNRYNEYKIIHEITDIITNNEPAGTRVTIIIPAGIQYNMGTHE